MLKFLYGFPGADVRRRYFSEILPLVEEKKRTFLIVPDQQVLDYEDESISALPGSAPLTFTVASFSLLGEIAERKFGGLSYKLLSKPIKALYMWKAIREIKPYLKLYGRVSPERLVSSMIDCIDELKTSGILPEDLNDAVHCLGDAEELSSKLSDVSLIYSAYTALIGNKYTDQNDSLMKLLKILRENRLFEDCEFFIDSFTDFTPLQMKVLERIIPYASNVTVALPTNPARDLSVQFETVRKTVAELSRLAEDYSIPVESETYEPSEDESLLSYATRSIWKPNAKKIASEPREEELPIEIYACRDRREEVYAAVNLVRRALVAGDKLSDIAIISRNPADYKKLLSSALKDAGLPLFTSDRTPLSHKVFVNYIQTLLRIIGYGWQREDVLSHLKCGLSNAQERDIQRYELYVTRWNLNGKRALSGEMKKTAYDRFTNEENAEDEYVLSTDRVKKDVLSQILLLEEEFKAAKTVSDMLRMLFEHLERCEIRKKLSDLATSLADYGDSEEADQTARVYSATVRLFDDTAFAVGEDTAVSVREFSSLLELLFSVSDLGSIPARQDELILADASLYRSFGHKTVILLGCVSGEFPKSVKKTGIISRAEKDRLEAEGIRFAQNAYEAASREYMYFWRAMGIAKEKLILTYPEKTGGDIESPRSSGIDKLTAIIPGLKVRKLRESIENLLYEPHSVLNMLSTYAPKSKLYSEISELLKEKDSSPERLIRNEGSLVGTHALDKETAERFIREPLYLSPTTLERFNGCAFSYFCEKLLKLDKGEKNEFNNATAGEIIHAAVESFLSCENASERSLSEVGDICNAAVDAYYEKICPDHLRDSERLRLSFRRAAIAATVLSMYLGGELGATDFRPLSFEFNTAAVGGLEISADKKAVITGRIDRIDKAAREGEEYLRIIDYKTGKVQFSLDDMKSGTELQLPVYLSSVMKEGRLPGGFLYISSATQQHRISSAAELADKEAIYLKLASGIEVSGIMNALFIGSDKKKGKTTVIHSYVTDELNSTLSEVKDSIKHSVNRIYSGDFNTSPSDDDHSQCKYCRFGAICRQRPRFKR